LWSTIVRSTPPGSLIVSSSSRLEVTVDDGKAAATALVGECPRRERLCVNRAAKRHDGEYQPGQGPHLTRSQLASLPLLAD